MLVLFLLLTLLSSVSCFTPPRIIYGGWTPILPGHPFYFGPVRTHQLEYASQPHQASSHYNSHSPYGPAYESHDEEEYRSYRYGKEDSRLYQHDQTKYDDHPRELPKISHILTKSIFSYYPPQSSYNKPKQPEKVEHKPVYLEIPKKPYDTLENQHKFAPYVHPAARGLLPQDLKVLNHGGEEAFLSISPTGKVNYPPIKPIGHINLDPIGHFPSSAVLGASSYKSNHGLTQSILRNFRPHAPHYQGTSNLNYVNHNHLHGPELHSTRESMNTFKGTTFPHSESDAIRSVKDTKQEHFLSYRPNSGIRTGPLNYYLDGRNYKNQALSSNLSSLTSTQLHPSTTGSFYDNKYASSHISPSEEPSANKDLHYSSFLNKINQVKKFISPKSKYYAGSKSHYTTPFLAPGSYDFNQYPKKPSVASLKAERNPYSPKDHNNYDYKNVKVGKFYREPSILPDAQDTPTVVEQELEIVHIPVEAPHQYSRPGDEEILYLKGSTPHKHSAKFRNLKPGNATNYSSKHYPETFLDDPFEVHILENYPHHGSDSESVSSHPNTEEYESVFVGTRSLNGKDFQSVSDDSQEHKVDNSIDKKQFFHAYYAPSDHTPPKGYLKMSTHEFHKLFKDAEIQYIQRDSAEELSSDRRSEKTSP